MELQRDCILYTSVKTWPVSLSWAVNKRLKQYSLPLSATDLGN